MPDLFREEALAALERGDQDGDVVRISPSWTRWLFWLVVAIGVASLAFGALGKIREHVDGNAIILPDGDVVAYFSGDARRRVRPGMTLRLLDDGTVTPIVDVHEEQALVVARTVAPAGSRGGAVTVVVSERTLLQALSSPGAP
jgi:hypothetical protein